MRYITIISSFFVGTCSAASLVLSDPCTAVCDLIPGACSEAGSSCVERFCTDLYWMPRGKICHSSIPGCELNLQLSCEEAQNIYNMDNADEFTVYNGEPGEDVSFADPSNPEIVRGRKGFQYLEVNKYMGPAMQVLLQSRSIREAIKADLQSPWSPMGNPVYDNFITLLRQMFDETSTEPLDLTMLLFTLMEEAHGGAAFDTDPNRPYEALFILLEVLAEVSPRVGEVIRSEIAGLEFCKECKGSRARPTESISSMLGHFPGSDRTYSITDMLRYRFGPQALRDVCFSSCDGWESTDHIVQRMLVSAPKFLTIGISRETEDGTPITTSLDQPLEIDLRGILPGGEEIRYRLVGVVRRIGQGFVADYLDTGRNEWVYTKDTQFHVINGRPRNGGADPCIVFYERI